MACTPASLEPSLHWIEVYIQPQVIFIYSFINSYHLVHFIFKRWRLGVQWIGSNGKYCGSEALLLSLTWKKIIFNLLILGLITIGNSTCHYIRGPNGYAPQSSISEAARTPNTARVAIGLTVFVVFMQTICSYGIVGPKYVREYNHFPLQWRKNERDGVSNYQPHDCLPNRLFRRSSKKTSKLRVTGLYEGNSPVIGEFHAQMASNAENARTHWRLLW